MAPARSRSLVAPVLATALAAASVSGASELLRVEDVFPPGVPACAVPPAAGEGTYAPLAERSAPVPLVETEGPDGGRDLRFVRWFGVEARPLSAPLPLVVEDGSVGVVLRADGGDPDWEVSIELLSEAGELLTCETCPDAPVAGESRAGRATVQIPSTDRPGGELVPGTYSFRVRATPAHPQRMGATRGDGVTVNVLGAVRTDAAVSVERRLDLNFVFTPSSTLDADLARTSPLFGDYLEHVAEWLAPTGIQLGRVTYVDLPRPDLDIIRTWGDAERLFLTSADVGRPRALNVYGVRKFDSPLNPVVGLSGGIPGPLLSGTRDSGIALRMEPFFACSTNCLGAYASLTAHEIGHYLGFYHTTESDLAHWDPILDTPDCTADFPYGCADFPYVMFPLIHQANTVWSPAQQAIARTHPLVQTVPVFRARPEAAAAAPLAPAAFPNPFTESVRFEAGANAAVEVAIHDVGGRLVRRVAAGAGSPEWDGRTAAGGVAPAGVYFARITRPGSEPVTVRIVKAR